MPGGDGTGPMGMGPATGRAAGYCSGNAVPGYATFAGGRGFFGFGRGRGFGGGGWGRRNRFYATGLPGWARAGNFPAQAPTGELDALKEQARILEQRKQQLDQRIQHLQSGLTGKDIDS